MKPFGHEMGGGGGGVMGVGGGGGVMGVGGGVRSTSTQVGGTDQYICRSRELISMR